VAALLVRSVSDDAARRVRADDLALFAAELREIAPGLPARIDAEPEDIEEGLARLVLTIIEFLRQVLEHQAVRRMEGGGLSDEQIERLGLALLRLQERLGEIKTAFGLEGEDLNIDLGPLGRLL
jgi:actin-like ATPase involved in cell morphogenesis